MTKPFQPQSAMASSKLTHYNSMSSFKNDTCANKIDSRFLLPTAYSLQPPAFSSPSAWTLLEMLVVLTLIAILSVLIFPTERSWQHQLEQHASLSLLLRSCEEARSRAMTQRLTTWLILQHPTSGKDSFILLQETENGDTSLITAWKELPKDIHATLQPLNNHSLPTRFFEKLPQNFRPPSNQLSGIAWNSEGSIIEPSQISILTLLTTSNKKIGQILFLKNSGRALLTK